MGGFTHREFFSFGMEKRKKRIGDLVKGTSTKSFFSLIDLLAVLASCRKFSGVLSAGRLEGLCCFTIQKAKGENKQKKSSRHSPIYL
jgi:hypothetical protein